MTLGLVLSLSACAPSDEPILGDVGYVEGYLGGVVADEPRAALIGREILSAGGTATDAAVAMGFALTVTYPAAASLGGGGVCVVNDNANKKTQAIDFLVSAPSRVLPGATRPTAVPALPRGLYALHARYGRLPWSRLLTPAEQLSRFGIVTSRALARHLDAVGPALLQDMEARRAFLNTQTGKAVGEGDRVVQLDLSVTLSRLRSFGPGEFYSGARAQFLVDAVRAAGGSLSVEDLSSYTPAWRETVKVDFGNHALHFAPPPAAAGVLEAQLMTMLTESDRYEDTPAQGRFHLLAESFKRAFADRQKWLGTDSAAEAASEARANGLMADFDPARSTPADRLGLPRDPLPENPSATTFIAVDPGGSAVACVLTLNNVFGVGRIAPGTGILLAAAPGSYGGGPLPLGPVLMLNEPRNSLFLAAAASGGATAPTALVQVLLAVLVDGTPLETAIRAPRVHHGGRPDLVYFERGLGEDMIRTLTGRGHRVAATPVLGQVNAVWCKWGLPYQGNISEDICAIRADPRGAGIAASAD